MGELFLWWLALELIGLVGLPVVAITLAHLPDRGWALSKSLSLLLLGWLIWFPLSALPVLPYSPTWILVTVLLFAAGNAALLWRLPTLRSSIHDLVTRQRAYIIASESIFTGGFALMAWFRSFTPAVLDTEKFMDMAFISSLWRTPHLPPPDPWLSGYPINYYYYGHFLLATIAKALGTQPGTAFNLGIALIFGLAAVAIFGVAANLMAALRGGNLRGLPVFFAALMSTLLVLVLGNLNGAQIWWQDAVAAAKNPGEITTPWAWWLHRDLWPAYEWWPPSRVIPGTINEFPAFSFVLADLHAHVLALPFAALAVGVALNLLLARGEGVRAFGRGAPALLALVATAVALGSLYAINGWDLPTYLGLALLALAIQQWLAHERRLDTTFLLDLFSAGVLLVALALLAFLPFYRGFVSPSAGIAPVAPTDRTALGYEVAIFGLPLFILGSLLILWLTRSWPLAVAGFALGILLIRGNLGGPLIWYLIIILACAALILWLTRSWSLTVAEFALGMLLVSGDPARTLIWCTIIILACAVLALQRLGLLSYQHEGDAQSNRVETSTFGESEPTPTAAPSPAPSPRRWTLWRAAPIDRRTPATVSTAGSPSTSDSTDSSARAEILLLVLFGTAAALIAACELVYLRDIFNSRMNTVFKLYFQAWLLLGIAAGPALALLLSLARARLSAMLLATPPRARAAHTPSTTAGALTLSQATRALAPQSATAPLSRLSLATSQAQPGSTPNTTPPSAQAHPNDDTDHSLHGPFPPREGSRGLGKYPSPNLPPTLRWLGAAGILIWGIVLIVLISAAAVYPLLATSARTGNFASSAHTLDGTAYMATDPELAPPGCTNVGAGSNAHDDEAIAWLNTHLSGEATIVEAPGCEWTHYSRVSAFTGLPTILGWPGGHEGEWRINWLPQHPEVGDIFADRLNAINQIYTDSNQDAVIALLHRYHARLIYVGAAERALYPQADMRRFGSFMRVIYTHDGITIYELP